MDGMSEFRLQSVHPQLAMRVRSMAEQLAEEGIAIKVVQGLRTMEEQEALYAQGRTAPGKIVTDAKPGYSYHCYGLAVDVAPFDDGIPDWNANHPAWKRIIAVGQSMGLVAGAMWRTFPDFPHFQFTGYLPSSPDDGVRTSFASGGIEGVWAETGLDIGLSA